MDQSKLKMLILEPGEASQARIRVSATRRGGDEGRRNTLVYVNDVVRDYNEIGITSSIG